MTRSLLERDRTQRVVCHLSQVLVASIWIVSSFSPAGGQPQKKEDEGARHIIEKCFGPPLQVCEPALALSRLEQEFRQARTIGECLDVAAKVESISRTTALDDDLRKEIQRLRDQSRRLASHLALGQQIELLFQEGKFDQGRPLLASILREATDERSVETYRRLHKLTPESEQDGFLGAAWIEARPIVAPTMIVVALLLLTYVVTRSIKWGYSWVNSVWGKQFRVNDIVDETVFGVSASIVSQLLAFRKEGNAPTAALLLLNATSIPTQPRFGSIQQGASLSSSVEALGLTLGTVNVGSVARFMAALWRWCFGESARLLVGKVNLDNGYLQARLTAQYPDKRLLIGKNGLEWLLASFKLPKSQATIVARAPINQRGDVSRYVAEEVVFKMIYALNGGSVEEGEAANSVRIGLDALRGYVDDDSLTLSDGLRDLPTERLRRAVKSFETARSIDPQCIDAYLYEGVALDLLEDHEGAIDRFEYATRLIGRTEKYDSDRDRLLKTVQYNKAVASLRSLYTVDAIRKSLTTLDEFLVDNPDPKSDPIVALAYAAKADAIACWTLHPEAFFDSVVLPRIDRNGTTLEVLVETATVASDFLGSLAQKLVVDESVRQVTDLTVVLSEALRELKKDAYPKWDKRSISQFEWSIENARGDLFLYAYLAWVDDAELSPTDEMTGYLDEALKCFDKCMSLFPPGVEILSNLGTLYRFRGKPGDLEKARRALNDVIRLNPNYEYAYQRLAESYVIENNYYEANRVVQQYRVTGRSMKLDAFGELASDIRRNYVVDHWDQSELE